MSVDSEYIDEENDTGLSEFVDNNIKDLIEEFTDKHFLSDKWLEFTREQFKESQRTDFHGC